MIFRNNCVKKSSVISDSFKLLEICVINNGHMQTLFPREDFTENPLLSSILIILYVLTNI